MLRWGRRRHPDVLTIEVAGLIDLPAYEHSRLSYAADALGLERLIEAVVNRRVRDPLLALRDAAMVAAMGFTVATRPSEWRLMAAWEDLREDTVELQRRGRPRGRRLAGLKSGAHVALILPNALDRLRAYRRALETACGPQPPEALVFQLLGEEGPLWARPRGGGPRVPLAWTKDAYTPLGEAGLVACPRPRFPGPRRAARSRDDEVLRLPTHGDLDGSSLDPRDGAPRDESALVGGDGRHSIQTPESHYRHIIVRHIGKPAIDLVEECAGAREQVERHPFRGARAR